MKLGIILAAMVAVGLLAGVALASHPEPAKAKKFSFDLVTGFFPCDGSSANTTTSNGYWSACAPAAPLGICSFSPTGSGKFMAVVTGSPAGGNQDVKFGAVAKGLTCEGGQLHLRLSFRMTTDDCPMSPCTTVDADLFDVPSAFCTVSNGDCKIKTTLRTAAPGLFPPDGTNTGITILGCGLKEFGFPLDPPELQCGILLK